MKSSVPGTDQWLRRKGRRRDEGIGGQLDGNDIRNFNNEFSTLEDRLTKLEEENHGLKDQVSAKIRHIANLEKTVLEGGNGKQCPGDGNKLHETLNVTEGLETGCGDALNTSTTLQQPNTALQSEHIQLKNRCEDLEKENLELRKLCGGNRTPKYLDLNNANRRYNTNLVSAQTASSPLSSSVSDNEMSPIEPETEAFYSISIIQELLMY